MESFNEPGVRYETVLIPTLIMGVGRSFPSNSCGLPIEAIEEGVHWLAQKVGELGLRAVASVDRVGFHAPLSVPLVSTSIYIYSTIYIYIYDAPL